MAMGKFPHEVREEMDSQDFNETLGYIIAEGAEQQELTKTSSKVRPNRARPQTMG